MNFLSKIVALSSLSMCLTFTLFAQNKTIGADEAPKYVGQTVDMLEMVNKVDYNSSTKTCTIVFPDHRTRDNSPEINIIIHHVTGISRINKLKALAAHWLHVHGEILYANNKYIINGDNPKTKWDIYTGTIGVPVPPPAPSADTLHKG